MRSIADHDIMQAHTDNLISMAKVQQADYKDGCRVDCEVGGAGGGR